MSASKSKEGAAPGLLSRHANPVAAAPPEDASVGPATAEDNEPQYDFKAFDDEEEEEESGPPKKSSAKCWYSNNDGPPPSSCGEIIAACAYPLAVNIWLWITLWNNEASTRVIDIEGAVHTWHFSRITPC